ncbi:MAG: hypothetical protein IT425_05195 [Pirellulales bacterium]|nr:hypothetical protein [Pirellulales bacterium]
MRPQRYRTTRAALAGGCALLALAGALLATPAFAGTFGVNFQTDRSGYGPYSVGGEVPASAFGVPAADWYEPGVVSSGSTNFSTNGGSVGIDFSAAPFKPGIAYGWTHANQGPPSPPGDPLSGEDVVLSAFLFAAGVGEHGQANGAPIVVTLSNLSSIADLSAGYTVTLYASSEWSGHGFTPASVQDSNSNSETVAFTIMPDHPLWWTSAPYESSGAVGSTTANLLTGDSVTITLTGWNESSHDGNRTSLAGLKVEFTPIPEPTSILMLLVGLVGSVIAGGRLR